MSILVTGSAGLIGEALIESLLVENVSVIGFDKKIQTKKSATHNFVQVEGDLTDINTLKSIFNEHSIESIIHAGGISHPFIGDQDPKLTLNTNILGTMNIFELAKEYSIKKVIYISSGGVYHRNDDFSQQEKDILRPPSIYGVSKLTGEHLGHVYSQKGYFDFIALRFPFIYGPQRKMPDPIKDVIEKVVHGEKLIRMNGKGESLEFIYIKDAIRGIQLALNSQGIKDDVFNIGVGYTSTMEEIAHAVQMNFPEVTIEFTDQSSGYIAQRPLDCSKAETKLNYRANYTLEIGIKEYSRLYLSSCIG